VQDRLKEETKKGIQSGAVQGGPGSSAEGQQPTLIAELLKYAKEKERGQLTKHIRWDFNNDITLSTDPKVVCLPAESLQEFHNTIAKMEYFEHQKVWVAKDMKSTKRLAATAAIAKAPIAKQITTLITTHARSLEVFNPPADSHATVLEWFKPKFAQMVPLGHTAYLTSNLGFLDCRLLLEGQETTFGVPLALLVGDTFQAKHEKLMGMDVHQFLTLVESCGFSYQAKLGELYVIPGRYAVITIGNTGTLMKNDGTHLLRWCLPGPECNRQFIEFYLADMAKETPFGPESVQRRLANLLAALHEEGRAAAAAE
jgi:hypothetical protein